MEALQSSRSYLGVGGCHKKDISNYVPRKIEISINTEDGVRFKGESM
jgi:hypothetical protein